MRTLARLAAVVLPGLIIFAATVAARSESGKDKGPVAVGPQYGTAHVYVAPADFDRCVAGLVATFGGTKSRRSSLAVTPTPSRALSQLVLTPVGSFSVFGFTTPIPFPFGVERTGLLVTDLDAAVASAKSHGADVVVTAFPDALGRDAIIEWPGGEHMQLYWHTTRPDYPALQTIPENHVYVSAERAEAFVTAFKEFAQGTVVSDDKAAPGVEIGRPNDSYRRIRIDSPFGKFAVLVTDGQLPYPYGHEIAGYEVANFSDTLDKAEAAGVTVLVKPYLAEQRKIAILQFPGGYIAEIHSPTDK